MSIKGIQPTAPKDAPRLMLGVRRVREAIFSESMAVQPAMKQGSPEQQLASFIARYTREIGSLAHEALAKMRALLPGAVELVYDNYNALAIALGPTDRRSDVVFSITLYPRWVSLFFTDGANLPDPRKLLKGNGKSIRHIVLDGASTLDEAPVRALIGHALKRAGKRWVGPTRIVIKSVSATQRPRRPTAGS
jgi:hypothetical protein